MFPSGNIFWGRRTGVEDEIRREKGLSKNGKLAFSSKGERYSYKVEVEGSSPSGPTRRNRNGITGS
jgi:hypothetical protein